MLRTIGKYDDKYSSGKFGWHQLRWDETAPSFGHVGKTYTLHPDGKDGDRRVVSPREVMALLGFPDAFRFPSTVPRTSKYRMVADAVSPIFGRALATAITRSMSARASD